MSKVPETKPFIFGLRCPYCESIHLMGALGLRPADEETAAAIKPTLEMIDVPGEAQYMLSEKVVAVEAIRAQCLNCGKQFNVQAIARSIEGQGDPAPDPQDTGNKGGSSNRYLN